MIPKLHKRGQSFKGACAYILHDPGANSQDRVLWTQTQNLTNSPEQAWREMHATWRDRVNLKRAAGVDLRGRDNTSPVLHLTLSWHADDKPTPEHMKETALSALKAIGLEGHQVLMTAHDDKDHLHVHLVINTVNPENGRTAPMKYTKERLSRWAEAYEKEHGLRVEQRVENNKKRDRLKDQRERNTNEILMAAQQGREPPDAMPYVPVKDHSPNRSQWLAKKDITDRMKRMRAEMELPHKVERNTLAYKHKGERDELWRNTKDAMDNASAHVRQEFRPHWRELYKHQKREMAHLHRQATHPLERAVYVFINRERLGKGKPLTLRQMASLILKPDKLLDRVDEIQAKERKDLARMQKVESRQLTERIMDLHYPKLQRLKAQQESERHAQWTQHRARTDTVSFARAKEQLNAERQAPPSPPSPERGFKRGPKTERVSETFARQAENPAPPAAEQFKQAAKREPLTRAEQIRRDMEEWRKRNRDRDQGREL